MKTTRIVTVLLSAGALSACTGDDGAKNPPVFGGEGAVIAKEQPLPEGSAAPPPYTGACKGPAPASDTALFDDFEDGDNSGIL